MIPQKDRHCSQLDCPLRGNTIHYRNVCLHGSAHKKDFDYQCKDKVLIAVNSHDALVEACEEALHALNAESELNEGVEVRNRRRIAIIKQALKQAKG